MVPSASSEPSPLEPNHEQSPGSKHDPAQGGQVQQTLRDWSIYARYSQLGLEMVSPIVLGLLIDYGLDTMPWGTIVGAVLGLVVGFMRLLHLQRIEDRRAMTRKDQR